MYVHFWHFNKRWYAEVNNNPTFTRHCSRNENQSPFKYWEEHFVEDSTFMTERQIRQKLRESYPNCVLIKDSYYHEGARWNGYKKGSRS